MTAAQTSAPKQYYLQDSRGNIGDNLSFWGAAGGYTTDIQAAELFSEDKAFDQNASRSSDLPWPTAYLAEHTRPVVDMQYVKAEEAVSFADGEHFYRQHPGREYIGNDILFQKAAGTGFTTNLDQVKVFSRSEVSEAALMLMPGIFWPKAYIDSKRRLAADYHGANLKQALAQAQPARTLAKPDKVRYERHRCHGCGIFLSAVNYYGDCPKCGAENRP
jgi:hypothetical protein